MSATFGTCGHPARSSRVACEACARKPATPSPLVVVRRQPALFEGARCLHPGCTDVVPAARGPRANPEDAPYCARHRQSRRSARAQKNLRARLVGPGETSCKTLGCLHAVPRSAFGPRPLAKNKDYCRRCRVARAMREVRAVERTKAARVPPSLRIALAEAGYDGDMTVAHVVACVLAHGSRAA